MATVDWAYWWWTAGILAAVFIVGFVALVLMVRRRLNPLHPAEEAAIRAARTWQETQR